VFVGRDCVNGIVGVAGSLKRILVSESMSLMSVGAGSGWGRGMLIVSEVANWKRTVEMTRAVRTVSSCGSGWLIQGAATKKRRGSLYQVGLRDLVSR